MPKTRKTTKPDYKPVEISIAGDCATNTFSDGGKVWRVLSLIHHAKDLEPFDLPLSCINLATTTWEGDTKTIKGFAGHMKRVNEADLKYPVIMDDDGFIMDGWHRVAKALVLGLATIKAVRFDKTPPCDYEKAE